tara:strand:- start:363 stop:1205 length:843 start_codon:yes stop_codon:yes gene_type:complete
MASTSQERSIASIISRPTKLNYARLLEEDTKQLLLLDKDIDSYNEDLTKLELGQQGIINQRSKDRIISEIAALTTKKTNLLTVMEEKAKILDRNVPGFLQYYYQKMDEGFERAGTPVEDRPQALMKRLRTLKEQDKTGFYNNMLHIAHDRARSPHLASPVGGPPFEHRTPSEIEFNALLSQRRDFKKDKEEQEAINALLQLRSGIRDPVSLRRPLKRQREEDSVTGDISALSRFGRLLKKMGPKRGDIKRGIKSFATKRKIWTNQIVNKMYNMYLRNNVD